MNTHPYDPLGPDGKPVKSYSYRNVLKKTGTGYKKAPVKDHFVKKVSPDEYPLNTSYTWSINKTMID
jgi:hypothetical protein